MRRLRLRCKSTGFSIHQILKHQFSMSFSSIQPVTLKVECTKLTCPPLNCPESEAYRPDPMACCKQCPPAPTTTAPSSVAVSINKDMAGEEAQIRNEADILSSGGCRFKGDVFENGEEWHPRIQPWGEMRCINCNCKVL